MKKIALIAGSRSDGEFIADAVSLLEGADVPHEVKYISAHRNLNQLLDYVYNAGDVGVFICVAGLSAHLPGVVAAATAAPVVGVPRETGPLHGMDALLSIAQMPKGVPVGCMGLHKGGAVNAVLYALRILALCGDDAALKLEKAQSLL